MPRNGSGSYALPAPPSPFVNGTTANATDVMTVLNDIASALTASIAKDGQTTATGTLNMGTNAITGVTTLTTKAVTATGTITAVNVAASSTITAAAGTSGTQVVNFAQFENFFTAIGGCNLPGGLQFRWGSGSVGAAGETAINYATAFTTETLQVLVGLNYAAGAPPSVVTVAATNYAINGFILGSSNALGYVYFAIGH